MRALHGELIGRTDKRQSRDLRDLGRSGFGESHGSIDASANRRPAQRQLIDMRQRCLEPLQVVSQHRCVAGPLLAKRQQRGVLHVRSPDLDDVFPLFGLVRDGIVQSLHRWN